MTQQHHISSPYFEDVWVIVPAYNEGSKITEVLECILECFKNVVVVNDGSTDDTQAVLSQHGGIAVVSHPINLGQGAALQTGISYALRQRAKWIVTMDADGQHDPYDALAMLNRASHTNLDICFGSRFLGTTIGMPFSRKILLRAALVFQTLTTGVKMTDVHNGLRVISNEAASKIRIRQNRMAHASEFVSLCKSLNLRFDEFPVTIRYSDYSRAKGQSSFGALTIIADLFIAKLRK